MSHVWAAEHTQRRGDKIPDPDRCRAMVAMGPHPGGRCCKRAIDPGLQLCRQHSEGGAVIPDLWTQPDNLPVFNLNVEEGSRNTHGREARLPSGGS